MSLGQGYGVYTGAVGTRNLPGIMGLGAAIDFLEHLGPQEIESHNLALRAKLVDGLQGVPGADIASPLAPGMVAPFVSLRLVPGDTNVKLADHLRETYSIVVKVLPPNLLNGIRISVHFYNTEQDIEALVIALNQALKKTG